MAVVVPPRVQPIEAAHAVRPQDHALAVEHERGGAQPTGGRIEAISKRPT